MMLLRNTKPSILVFAGSTRQDSVNKKLARQTCDTAQRLRFEASFIDLKDYPMPLYDGDLEQGEGIPETARDLEAVIKKHDAVIIASPEYNGAFTPLLKNTIDWVSRVELGFLKPKVVGLISASPGRGGGARSLALVRTWLKSMQVNVAAESFSLPGATQAFTNDRLDEAQQAALERFVNHVVETVEEKKSVTV